MSEEFRALIAKAADLVEDEVSYDSITLMAKEFQCESTAPIDLAVSPGAPRMMQELVEWCLERITKDGKDPVALIRAARVAAVRSIGHLELWLSRRCGALRRGGYAAESAKLLARCAPATRLASADWSDADSLAAQPQLLLSIDGNVAGVIFNHADKFNGFDVIDILHAWVASLVLTASRERDIDQVLALMCEAGQALNYAGFMDGCEAGEQSYRESGAALPPAAFAVAAAKRAANARHAENRSMKVQVIDWYLAHGAEYTSKDDAALAATAIVPMKFRTIRDWIAGIDR